MPVIPNLVVDGQDVSRYVVSVHVEMSANLDKDPGKYDIKLANVGGRFIGAFRHASGEEIDPSSIPAVSDTYVEYEGLFNPIGKVLFSIINTRKRCPGETTTTTKIFDGEVQDVQCDEVYCNIRGSCQEGGMTSSLHQHKTYPPGTPIGMIVIDLLDEFGVQRHYVAPKNNIAPDKTMEFKPGMDFSTAFSELASDAQSIYFFDEDGRFNFVDPFETKGNSVDLTGSLLKGTNAKNLIGHYNIVYVFGFSSGPYPADPFSEIPTHNNIFAVAKDDNDILECGEMVAPPIFRQNAPLKMCKEIAENTLQDYMQYRDVPQIKVVGHAPPLMSPVSYIPYNGNLPPTNCNARGNITMGPITGWVVRKIVDFDANGGFVSTLDIATSRGQLIKAGVSIGE